MEMINQKRLQKVIVGENTSIQDALRTIKGNGRGAVFVVDEDYGLKGILTDGDIRAGILKNINMNVSVRALMNTNPTVVKEKKSPEAIHRLMMDTSLNIIPRINKAGRVVDYYFLREISDLAISSSTPRHIRGARKPSAVQTVLVIGGAGYIGSVLVRQLLKDGYQVDVFDSLLYGRDSLLDLTGKASFKLIQGDVRNTEMLMSALPKADAVVHLGEIVGDPACALNDDFTINVNFLATKNISEICLIYGIRRLIFVSSCSVYGRGEGLFREDSKLNPVSLYAKCKIQSEKILLSDADEDFHPTILRLATVFGASHRPRFDLVINLLTAKAMQEGAITLFGGEQWRPFINVKDVVRAIRQILKAPEGDVGGNIYNVGDDRLNYKIKDIGKQIKRVFPDVRIQVSDQKGDNRSYLVSFSKIKEHLGFECRWNLLDGIQEIREMIINQGISDYRYKYYHNHLSLLG